MRRAARLVLLLCLLLSSATFAQEVTPSDKQKMELAPVSGGQLEYVSRGDGEPVLFIHGAHIADSFLPLMEEASLANYSLIRYHRRGHVGSTPPEGSFSIEQEAADAVALLRHLDIERAHIVGHSSGGVIAIELALYAPDVVHSLVLIEPALMTDLSALSAWVAPLVERYHSGDISGAVDAFMRPGGGAEWKAEVARTVRGGPERAERDARAFFEIEVPAMLQWKWDEGKAAQIAQPILYVNQSGPAWEGKKQLVQSWFPRAKHHLVENVNHLLPMQDPRSVAEGIADFLRRHSF